MASSRSKLAWRTRAERGVEGWKPARRIRSALATPARAKPCVLCALCASAAHLSRSQRIRGGLARGGVGVLVGELGDFVAEPLVGGDLAKELPHLRIGQRLDRVAAGLGLLRDGAWAPGEQRRHAIDVVLGRKEIGLLPGQHRGLIGAQRRGELLGGAPELLAERLDVVSRHASPPAIVIFATRIVGAAVAVRRSRSLPTASMLFHRSSTLSEIVTSLTGNASSPFSIQKPAAPREKSPVTAFESTPGWSTKFDVLDPTPAPPPRDALAVLSRPSLRAE